MIFLYTFLLLFLGIVKALIDRRVARLERKYARVAMAADALLHQPVFREGNSNRSDPCQTAKRQFLLGGLVQKRDRIEAKHVAWQQFSEKFGRLIVRLRDWKGKKLPYTLGVVDVSCVLCVIDYLGVGEYVSVRRLIELIVSHFAN
jgi:hypothetical protein